MGPADWAPGVGLAEGVVQPANGQARVRRTGRRDSYLLVTFGLGVAAVAIFHFIVLHRTGNLTGGDYGNWLTLGHRFLGQGLPMGSQSTYPPVIPVVTVATVSALGPLWGPNVLAALIGCAPAIGIYVVLRRSGLQWSAVMLSLVVAGASSSGEAIAWGGLPQLLGFGIGVVLLDEVVRLLRAPTPKAAWRAGALLLALGATSHLVLGQVGAASAVALAGHVVLVRRGLTLRGPWLGKSGWLATTARVLLPSVILVPLYVTLLRAVGGSVVSGSQSRVSLSQALQQLNRVFADAPTLWKSAAVMAAVSPLLLWSHRRTPLWIEGAAVTWMVFTSLVILRQDRFLYLLPVGVTLALASWAPELEVRRGLTSFTGQLLLATLGVVLFGWFVFAGLRQFPSQQTFYGSRLFPPKTVQDLNWLKARTPANSLIAVAPVYGLPFGWWVEGYGRRATLVGSSSDYLSFPLEQQRAEQADSLFSLTTATPAEVLLDARRLGIDYLYIPTTWGGLHTTSVGTLVDRYPRRVVLDNAGAVIVRTGS